MGYQTDSGRTIPVWGMVVAVIVGIILFGVFLGSCGSLNGSKSGPTQVIVERNGGPFDSKTIRGVKGPASSISIHGLYTQNRHYIAGNEKRYYKVSSDPSLGEKSGADYIQVPTKDGVNVAVDAQLIFSTAFTSPDGEFSEPYQELVKKFDTSYGNRNYKAKDGDSKKVWDGNDGWNAFLDTMFRPVVENAFREQIGAVNCADLVSSCALVQSSENQKSFAIANAKDNQKNFELIQTNVQEQLQRGINTALGDEYLTGFGVQITKITLPESVQTAIDTAQASFAQIAEARAQNIQSKYQAESNERLADAYAQSPALAQIKMAEILQDSTATIILGDPGVGYNLGK